MQYDKNENSLPDNTSGKRVLSEERTEYLKRLVLNHNNDIDSLMIEIAALESLFEGLVFFADCRLPDMLQSFGIAFSNFVKSRPDFASECMTYYSELAMLISVISRFDNLCHAKLDEYEDLRNDIETYYMQTRKK